MTELLSLEPRVAGIDVIDPSAYFDENPEFLHHQGRCQDTIECEFTHTHGCPHTGPPR